MRTNDDLNRVKSVDKALVILDCFYERKKITFSELKELTKFPNGTMSRMLNSLINGDYINKDPKTGLYSLGKKLFILGFTVIKNLDFHKIVHPILEDLGEVTKETANGAIFFDNGIAYIDVVEERGVHEGVARVFDEENDAVKAVKNGEIKEGEIIFVTGCGPKAMGCPSCLE